MSDELESSSPRKNLGLLLELLLVVDVVTGSLLIMELFSFDDFVGSSLLSALIWLESDAAVAAGGCGGLGVVVVKTAAGLELAEARNGDGCLNEASDDRFWNELVGVEI